MGEFQEGLADALSPYVRALAWWHAVPQPPTSTLKNPPKRMPQRNSRVALRLEAGGEPDLPDLEPGLAFVVFNLFDAGPTGTGGQHGSPLSWADLQAWQSGSGVSLPPWMLRLLRRLSGEYLAEALQADAHDAPPPWEREPDRERIAQHIRRVIRG